MRKNVFVTVGTTRFDALIQAVDDSRALNRLSSLGYTSLVAQIGHGEYVPSFSSKVIRSPVLRAGTSHRRDVHSSDQIFQVPPEMHKLNTA